MDNTIYIAKICVIQININKYLERRLFMKRYLGCILSLMIITACASPIQQSSPLNSPLDLQIQIDNKLMNEDELSDFLIQSSKSQNKAKSNSNKPPKNTDQEEKEKKSRELWSKNWNQQDAKRIPDLLITDVLLTDTNQSIMGSLAPASIAPDYNGKDIYLTIKGTFKDKKKTLALKSFLFTLDPGLLLQTFIGKKPSSRVLLDHSILLETISASANELKIKLNSRQIPDLYLKGLHHLAVENDNYFTDALIQIGSPEPVSSLTPIITSVETIYQDDIPVRILIKGQHLMVYPKFSHTTIDGEFGFGFQTEVLTDGTSEATVHIPNPSTFDRAAKHSLVYSTPFGVAFTQFGGAQ